MILAAFVLTVGRGERIRTFDPLVPNQMRYQAAPRPDTAAIVTAGGKTSPVPRPFGG